MNENDIKNEKLQDLIPLSVDFFPGESPTAEKLEGMMTQVEKGIEFLEKTTGDMYNQTLYSSRWMSSLSQILGDNDLLNPLILPSYVEDNYIQDLVLGRTDHELDFIPVGSGQALINNSTDTSVVIGQFKTTVDGLERVGDWTILPTYTERGRAKNQKRLVTHAPSDGGNITFAQITTGRAGGMEGMTYNVIPTMAQAEEDAGMESFVDVVLSDDTNHIFTLTLPEITHSKSLSDENISANLSNTTSHIVPGRQYHFPEFFFDFDGLNLEQDSNVRPGFGRIIPSNLIQIFEWTTKQRVTGIVEMRASQVQAARRYQITVQTETGTELDPSKKYIITVAGATLSQYIKVLSHHLLNHNHASLDMERRIKHSDLMNLRTSTTNSSNRSEFYGVSSIPHNDHSMYLHRDGYTSTDIGAGGNILRGDLVIGNTSLGVETEHEHFNLISDSFSLKFGQILDAAGLNYTKAFTHSILFGRHNIPKDFSGEIFEITGAKHSSGGKLNSFLKGSLRIEKDVTLGSEVTDSVIINGNAYIQRSLTLLPSLSSVLPLEAGTVFYNETQKELNVYNGSALIAPGRTGIAVLVGDNVLSWGKFNGADYTTLENAIAEAATLKGTIKLLKGTYDIGSNTLVIPQDVKLTGEGNQTIIKGSGTIIRLSSDNSEVSHLTLSRTTLSRFGVGIEFVDAHKCSVQNVTFKEGEIGIKLDSLSSENIIGDGLIFSDVTVDDQTPDFPEEDNYRLVRKLVGITNELHMFDYGSKKTFINRWKINSGIISTSFSPTSSHSTLGQGTMIINGTGEIVFGEMLAIAPTGGVGIYLDARRIGSLGNVSIGIICYDRDGVLLGKRSFILDSSDLTDSMTYYYGALTNEGTNPTNDFIAGTRYAKIFIEVNTNDGGLEIDNVMAEPLTLARYSTFA